jgi:DNA-binding IclR family transcriptional regulator
LATADRVLSVLGLFTVEEPEWTVEGAMSKLGLSSSTAYLYFRSLVEAGLLVAGKGGRYNLGPAVISLDRVTRRHDPLITEARDAMRKLVAPFVGDVVALLCRSFRLKVMCVDQYSARPTALAIGYERGRPMQLYRGAASKSILAHLSSRTTRKLWDTEAPAIAAAGLGEDWEGFKRNLRALRKSHVVVTCGDIDPGLVGISAPVVAEGEEAIGSIGIVVANAVLDAKTGFIDEAVSLVDEQARALSARLSA